MSNLTDFFGNASTVLNKPMMHLQQTAQDIASTAGGTYDRVMDNVIQNDIIGASVAGASISLPAGTYYIAAFSNAKNTNWTETYIRDSSNNVLLTGTSLYPNASTHSRLVSEVSGQITLASTTSIKLSIYTGAADSTGLGNVGGNVNGDIKIWQLG